MGFLIFIAIIVLVLLIAWYIATLCKMKKVQKWEEEHPGETYKEEEPPTLETMTDPEFLDFLTKLQTTTPIYKEDVDTLIRAREAALEAKKKLEEEIKIGTSGAVDPHVADACVRQAEKICRETQRNYERVSTSFDNKYNPSKSESSEENTDTSSKVIYNGYNGRVIRDYNARSLAKNMNKGQSASADAILFNENAKLTNPHILGQSKAGARTRSYSASEFDPQRVPHYVETITTHLDDDGNLYFEYVDDYGEKYVKEHEQDPSLKIAPGITKGMAIEYADRLKEMVMKRSYYEQACTKDGHEEPYLDPYDGDFKGRNEGKYTCESKSNLTYIHSGSSGRILSIYKSAGDTVQKNEPIILMESMKMEIKVRSLVSGTVQEIRCHVLDNVDPYQTLAVVKADHDLTLSETLREYK